MNGDICDATIYHSLCLPKTSPSTTQPSAQHHHQIQSGPPAARLCVSQQPLPSPPPPNYKNLPRPPATGSQHAGLPPPVTTLIAVGTMETSLSPTAGRPPSRRRARVTRLLSARGRGPVGPWTLETDVTAADAADVALRMTTMTCCAVSVAVRCGCVTDAAGATVRYVDGRNGDTGIVGGEWRRED